MDSTPVERVPVVPPELCQQAAQVNLEVTERLDWSLCVICQQVTGEKLCNPAAGFSNFVNNIKTLNDLQYLTSDMMPSYRLLGDPETLESRCELNNAIWHKKCRNKIDDQKLQRAKKRKATVFVDTSPVKTRTMAGSFEKNSNCFFCGASGGEKLFSARTLAVDKTVRERAEILQDRPLLAKLSQGDMHALDAQYHASCMLSLHNKCRLKNNNSDLTDDSLEIIVLGELVFYIEEQKDNANVPVFKLSEIRDLFDKRVHELDPTCDRKTNSTRLKDTLLAMIPDLKAHRQGREIVLLFDKDLSSLVEIAAQRNDNAAHLARAAHIIRKEISFDGTFSPGIEEDCVPAGLKAFLGMVMHGTSFDFDGDERDAKLKSILSVSQLVMFNTKKKDIAGNQERYPSQRHSKARETPLPIYLSLKMYFKTRRSDIIDTLHEHGLSISYKRTMKVMTQLGNAVCARFEDEHCVCPPKLRETIFTTGAVDNIDHNMSSTTSKESFHGTAISLTQFPTEENPGSVRQIRPPLIGNDQEQPALLPPTYTCLPEVGSCKESRIPVTIGEAKAQTDSLVGSREKENEWLSFIVDLVKKEKLQAGDFISWAAYHASRQPPLRRKVCNIALLPLFAEKSQSVAMIMHAMNLIKQATQRLNPEQIPVITADMPLYAIAKQIQWQYQHTHGEDRFVVVLGGLHIEMNFLKLLGDWLDGSGWKAALVQCGVSTTGRVDAVAKGTKVTKARYAHQVTAAALHMLLCEAHGEYLEGISTSGGEALSLTHWKERQFRDNPQFKYWSLVLYLELLYLQFVRSLREANFKLYVQCLGELAPWMFGMDHTNYARWLPVHIRDMVQLPVKKPSVDTEFKKGHFTVQKTTRAFSAIAMDQAHEQCNEQLKAEGGIIGLTDNPSALLRWITAGPEVNRILEEFQNNFKSKCPRPNLSHHEQTVSFQNRFAKDMKSMYDTVRELGNPFQEDSQYLVTLDTKRQKETDVLNKIQQTGQSQYDAFVEERLVNCSRPITDTISKNKFQIFTDVSSSKETKQTHQVSSLKNNCELFGRLYIACQSRKGDLEDFFNHENQNVPHRCRTEECLEHAINRTFLGAWRR